jgi:hypothetical protein
MSRILYSSDRYISEIDEIVYAIDASTIDLCMSLFPWARFRKRKSAIKLHAMIDLYGSIPAFVAITEGKVHDVNALDWIIFEAGKPRLSFGGSRVKLSWLPLVPSSFGSPAFLCRASGGYRRLSNPSGWVSRGWGYPRRGVSLVGRFHPNQAECG